MVSSSVGGEDRGGGSRTGDVDLPVNLDADIASWYKTTPQRVQFAATDTAEDFFANRSKNQINRTLAINVKTSMIRLISHRPCLRADAAAYPRSSAICLEQRMGFWPHTR